jgi:alpha-1,6-mannosyltransferase
VGALGLSELFYLSLLRLDGSNGLAPVLRFWATMGLLFVLYFAAARWAGGLEGRIALRLTLAGAILFRLTLLPAGLPHDLPWSEIPSALTADLQGKSVVYERFLLFDSDLWRYLWEGRVAAHRFDPFLVAPDSPALDPLAEEGVWQRIRDSVNHPDKPSIYPPLAQMVFRITHAIAPGSVFAWKALVALADLGAAAFLAFALRRSGRRASEAMLYSWNPLVLKVYAGSGHVDAFAVLGVAMLCWAVAARSTASAVVGLGGAILAKLFPIVLVPLAFRRLGWRGAAGLAVLVLAALLPWLASLGAMFLSLTSFGRTWRFNEGIFRALEWTFGATGATLAVAFGVMALAGWVLRSDDCTPDAFFRNGAVLLGAVLLASPAVMPWYVPVVLPLAVLARHRVWIWFSLLVCLAFHVMISQVEWLWLVWLEYLLLLAALLWKGVRQWPGREDKNHGKNTHADVPGVDCGALLSG